MAIPWLAMTAASLVASYVLVARGAGWETKPFVHTFLQTWFFQAAVWAVWAVVLYPKFFSPLRHLPMPPGGTFFNGHFNRIAKEATGIPHREW